MVFLDRQARESSPEQMEDEELVQEGHALLNSNNEGTDHAVFVPAWEGIRGLAVNMTCVSHFLPIWGPMADTLSRMGVGIFFVLSGYLITGVLQKKQNQYSREQGISYRHLRRFYVDRMVRLYPALIFNIVTIIFLNWLFIPNSITRDTFNSAKISLLYLTDIYISTPKGVFWQNTWTLAVEEQFYIGWSLILPLVLALHRKKQILAVGALFLLSETMIYLAYADIVKTQSRFFWGYFAPLPNFAYMFFGAAVQLSPTLAQRMRRRWSCWIGLLLVLSYIISVVPPPRMWTYFERGLQRIGVEPRFLSWKILMSPITCLATGLMLIGGKENGNIVLESPVLRYFGRISYSLYLYQAPLFWTRTHWTERPNRFDCFAYNSTAILMAMLSTYYIEEPIRAAYRRWSTRSEHQKMTII